MAPEQPTQMISAAGNQPIQGFSKEKISLSKNKLYR